MFNHRPTTFALALILGAMGAAGTARAQDPSPPQTRTETIEQAQAAKAQKLKPFKPGRAEEAMNRVEEIMAPGAMKLHPFFSSAYSGGGFTLGAGYLTNVSAYNTLDLRGSITFAGYKRLEAAFLAPRLLNRHASLSLLGGWREATTVGFYGIGTENTSKGNRANYSFTQPYGAALLDYWPARKLFLLRGGLDVSTWNIGAGKGDAPSIDEVYTSETLAGLGASTTYLHTEGTAALDSRTSPGYTRRGGFYGVTFNDFHDTDSVYGFQRVDYEAIQHVPILRDAWVLALHGRVETATAKDGQVIPFFMLPALGGGSSLRGFPSWRFRDSNSLLLQAEWRVLVNRAIDMALFYDAGRVSASTSGLTDSPLKSDYGLGFRFHTPLATPLRIDFAKSNEGLNIVFSTKASF